MQDLRFVNLYFDLWSNYGRIWLFADSRYFGTLSLCHGIRHWPNVFGKYLVCRVMSHGNLTYM